MIITAVTSEDMVHWAYMAGFESDPIELFMRIHPTARIVHRNESAPVEGFTGSLSSLR